MRVYTKVVNELGFFTTPEVRSIDLEYEIQIRNGN